MHEQQDQHQSRHQAPDFDDEVAPSLSQEKETRKLAVVTKQGLNNDNPHQTKRARVHTDTRLDENGRIDQHLYEAMEVQDILRTMSEQIYLSGDDDSNCNSNNNNDFTCNYCSKSDQQDSDSSCLMKSPPEPCNFRGETVTESSVSKTLSSKHLFPQAPCPEKSTIQCQLVNSPPSTTSNTSNTMNAYRMQSQKATSVVPSNTSPRMISGAKRTAPSFHTSEYLQLCSDACPLLENDPLLGDLPPEVHAFYCQRGITQLYACQRECLLASNNSAQANPNLLFLMPTSGGKTLVAEILALKTMLLQRKDAILILPYVAIVEEKIQTLQPLADCIGFHLEMYASHYGRVPPLQRRDGSRTLFVATIEKSHVLISSLLEKRRLGRLGLCIVDEVHMLGYGLRGGLLEMVLVTLLHHAFRSVRIVAMTATIGNKEDIAKFLCAQIVVSNQRPVQLQEYVLYKGSVFNTSALSSCIEESKQETRPYCDPQSNSKSDAEHSSHIHSTCFHVSFDLASDPDCKAVITSQTDVIGPNLAIIPSSDITNNGSRAQSYNHTKPNGNIITLDNIPESYKTFTVRYDSASSEGSAPVSSIFHRRATNRQYKISNQLSNDQSHQNNREGRFAIEPAKQRKYVHELILQRTCVSESASQQVQQKQRHRLDNDLEDVMFLMAEASPQRPCLVFNASRKACENLATSFARKFQHICMS